MKSPQLVALGLAGLLAGSAAAGYAQDSNAQADPDKIKALEQQVQLLLQQQQQLKDQEAQNEQRIKDLVDKLSTITKAQQAPAAGAPGSSSPTPPPATKAPPVKQGAAVPPFKWNGDITYRVDDEDFTTYGTGVVPTGNRAFIRERFRFNLSTPLTNRSEVGMQLTSGENQTPTSPFVTADDAFRGKPVTFGRAYFDYHFGDHPDSAVKNDPNNDAAIFLGKMPNPFWRADVGPMADEMVWDNDVNPEGVALRTPFTRRGSKFGVTNSVGYFDIFQTSNQRFAGITTDTYMIEDQIKAQYGDQSKVDAPRVQFAAGYLHFDNLNSQLHVPTFTNGLGVVNQSNVDGNNDSYEDPNAGVNAWLLQPALGLQETNNHATYGGGASGFVRDHFDVIDLVGQVWLPFISPKYQPWITGDWIHNFAVPQDGKGYGIELGIGHDPLNRSLASQPSGMKGQWLVWGKYEDMDADASLATIADSDIGAGTDYRGGELGINYHVQNDLVGQLLWIRYDGYPLKENGVGRVFVDIIKNF